MDSRRAKALRKEDGWVLFSVMVAVVILFTLVTMLLSTVVQHTFETARYQARTTAVHVADAGVNAYLYELKHNGGVFMDSLGPTAMDDGTWSVSATQAAGGAIHLTSVGVVPSLDVTRTVKAEVRRPTYADYMFLVDDSTSVGTGATIYGKMRVNGNITNTGTITGRAEASGSVSGSGQFQGGRFPNQPRVDFASVTADIADIRAKAEELGTAFEPARNTVSGAVGWEVVISGNQLRATRVRSVATNGALTTQGATITKSVPAEGVFYFNDTVWVSGNYSAAMTIAAEKFILAKNLLPVNQEAAHVIGLVSAGSIEMPLRYNASGYPTDLRLTAAMLAQNGGIGATYVSGYNKNSITIIGSLAYKTHVGFSSGTSEFRVRDYRYDSRLERTPPPMYPQIKDGSYKVSSWLEEGGG